MFQMEVMGEDILSEPNLYVFTWTLMDYDRDYPVNDQELEKL